MIPEWDMTREWGVYCERCRHWYPPTSDGHAMMFSEEERADLLIWDHEFRIWQKMWQ